MLEGVAFSLMDAQAALGEAAGDAKAVPLIGGGARSRLWMRIVASALGRPILRYAEADKGPAFGAARLARLALTGEAPADVCHKPAIVETVAPDDVLHEAYRKRFASYRALYRALKARALPPRVGSRLHATP